MATTVSSRLIPCTSCCSNCSEGGDRQILVSLPLEIPYRLDNLIPVGTILVNLDAEPEAVGCNHVHAEDGWHPFQGSIFKEHLTVDDDALQRNIEFLILHQFISATYQLNPSASIILRIYIIPYDLANVQGKLRTRKDAIIVPARRFLKDLLPRISQDHESWDGASPSTYGKTLVPNNKDRRTLAEIYGELQSPKGRVTPGWETITSRLLNFEYDLGGLGMRSKLYKYQRRSVCAMIDRELNLNDIYDPLFIPLTSIDGEVFFLQPGTMEVLRERPKVATSRSGVLCEELGTGKTVMILALVLATIDQISSPEESIMDDRPVMTPLSFRYFPSTECVTARKRFFRGKKNDYSSLGSRVPSLVELLLHHLRTAPDISIMNLSGSKAARRYIKKNNIAEQVEQIRPGEWLRANTPFYHHYEGVEPTNNERSKRNDISPGPRVMYLTSATLIIVPANLISQWDREIQKHCNHPIRVLILRSGTPMPHATSLASDFDIILMTYKRFTTEYGASDKKKLHSWNLCRCPALDGSRVPNCCCATPVSPLLQIRWKRLVIDEGHVSASLSTVLTPFTKLLSVERRWIVTGTPTTNLLGLSLGKKVNEGNPDDLEDDLGDYSPIETDYYDESPSETPSLSHSGSQTPIRSENTRPRIWNKDDREDLNKLGRMITHFLAVPQFTADPKLVQTHIVEPLLDRQGPRCGAIQVLNQVMEMIMIRHRIEDVEEDVVLPPVKQEAVLLDLDPYVVKSYNALQAIIAINAIDSQRTDQDYMFHPRNTEFLQLTVKNMSQLMFWSTNDELYYVDELVKSIESTSKRAIERGMPLEDIKLLEEAFKHVKLAAEDPLWRAMQGHEDVSYRVSGIKRSIFDAWTRTPQPEPTHNPYLVGFMHTDRLLKIRNLIISRPRISEETLLERGASTAAKDLLHRQLYKAEKSKDQKAGRKSAHHHDGLNASLKTEDAAKKAKDPVALKEMQKELDLVLGREDDELVTPPRHTHTPRNSGASQLVASSLLGKTRLGSSASSKLNYIINEVLRYTPQEKFLIFSDSELTLAHLGEALALVNVRFLRFTTTVGPRVREQVVLTFETSPSYSVFLMELKHGARGLNLISASRVIFCEPVWQADVESQAIKRAHRIGQTKPISVKILAIRGTAEENMVERRNLLRDRQEKVPKLIEEAGMRHYIANPKFINHPPERYSTVDVPLINIDPGFGSPSGLATSTPLPKRIRVEEPMSPLQKKRGVRFE